MDPAPMPGPVHRTLFPLRTPGFTGDSVRIGSLAFRREVRCDALPSSRPLPLVGSSLQVGAAYGLRLSERNYDAGAVCASLPPAGGKVAPA